MGRISYTPIPGREPGRAVAPAPEPAPAAPPYEGADVNPEGAANDVFGYTQGSLLTPWAGRFDASGYDLGGGGGYTAQAAAYTPFNYQDFNYAAPDVGQFEEVYNDPAAFRFADFSGPQDFRAPTAEDMKADPGYQARMDAVKNAQVAGAAHGGVLRSGGFQKGLAQAVGNQASQEYGNVYGRRASEHDRLRKEREGDYGINQGNTFEATKFNTGNRLQAYQTRQGTWQNNAEMKLRQGELGANIAQGQWDRNYGKARQGWTDEAQHQQELAQAANASAASRASSGAANARWEYERDLGDYTRARDEFWTNQDRQYAILDRERNAGLNAAGQYGGQIMNNANAQADYSMGGANARAAGTMGSANAWGEGLSGVGNTVGGGLMYAGMYGNQPPAGSTRPNLPASAGSRTPGVPMTGPYTAPRTALGHLPTSDEMRGGMAWND
jgi:hypothetical protein